MKNFIVTTDQQTANKLIADGFQLVSQVGNTYTFKNQTSVNFSLNDAEKKKIAYTNILSL